jgi:hypothetical protein
MRKSTLLIFIGVVAACLLLFSCSMDSSPPPSYAISFYKNHQDATGTMPDQIVESGATVNLNLCTYTNTGYTFLGWATLPTLPVAYADGASFTMGDSDVILYGKWQLE